MDLIWRLHQENTYLQQENHKLRRKFAETEVAHIPIVDRSFESRFFTDEEMKFIRERGLNYNKVYRIANKYGCPREAIVKVLAATYYV